LKYCSHRGYALVAGAGDPGLSAVLSVVALAKTEALAKADAGLNEAGYIPDAGLLSAGL
jgi:hypothetical protein